MKNIDRYLEILSISLEAVFANRFRSFLTALGIIFGVAAVIAMMSIGKGARQEILDQIKLVGVNNIIISAKRTEDVQKKEDDDNNGKNKKSNFSPGLSLADAKALKKLVPGIKTVSPEIEYSIHITENGKRKAANLKGVDPNFFALFNLETQTGKLFTEKQQKLIKPICVIGNGIKNKVFPKENPVGKTIKCDKIWFRIIGVLKNYSIGEVSSNAAVKSNYNNDVFVPITTINSRYKDRSHKKIAANGGRRFIIFGDNNKSKKKRNEFGNNQLNRLVVQVKDSKDLSQTAELIIKILKRRHKEVDDFVVEVPELLLKQEQKNKEIFNIVLGAIASISLIVGGIGIMNIMLASVMERIREIGVRRSIGATKKDIILQFLLESIFISIAGGIIGVILGVGLSKLISQFADIKTIISIEAIITSFFVSAAVGILFGYMPAKKAAEQNPVESLRHN
ncbi:MAG: ABC transporter permease [Bacteroidales bacterium]